MCTVWLRSTGDLCLASTGALSRKIVTAAFGDVKLKGGWNPVIAALKHSDFMV
jgi:hypothetical protein